MILRTRINDDLHSDRQCSDVTVLYRKKPGKNESFYTIKKLINTNPSVDIKKIDIIDIGNPVTRKSCAVRYGFWKSSTINRLFTFGNEETGNAMAADTKNTKEKKDKGGAYHDVNGIETKDT